MFSLNSAATLLAMLPSCDLFVAVGEPSGDAYAAAIVETLRQRQPDLEIAAMGGDRLRAAGAEIDQGIDGLAVMGLLPVLKRLPEFRDVMRTVTGSIRERKPRVLLTVDYPGFNLRLGRGLVTERDAGLHHVHVVAPQVWAWRPRRAKRIARTVDELLCFFPFEPPLFRRHGGRAAFIGHPLVDLVGDLSSNNQPTGKPLLLLAPGSRHSEVTSMLPVMDQAVSLLRERLGIAFDVIISRAPDRPLATYKELTDLPVSDRPYRELCREAHAAVITSGTATLEAALLHLPHVIAFRSDPVTARVATRMLKTKHIGLPNIVHGRRVCPELTQLECTPQRMADHLIALWGGARRDSMVATLATTADVLGGGGALSRVADVVAARLASVSVG